jgi:hypothetical protein
MLIPNLLRNSNLIIDSASYLHSFRQADRLKEGQILERNVPFCKSMLQAQPYDLIKLNKPKHKCYVIDHIFAAKGHTVLRLLLYHPDLNPTERIWVDVKQLVASKNTLKIMDAEQLWCQIFEETGHKDWENVCQLVEDLDNIIMSREALLKCY